MATDEEVKDYKIKRRDGTYITRRVIRRPGKSTKFQSIGSKGEVTREISETKSGQLVDQTSVQSSSTVSQASSSALQERQSQFNERFKGKTAREVINENEITQRRDSSGRVTTTITPREQPMVDEEKKENINTFYQGINKPLFSADIKRGDGTTQTITYTSERPNDNRIIYGSSVPGVPVSSDYDKLQRRLEREAVISYRENVAEPVTMKIDEASVFIKSNIPGVKGSENSVVASKLEGNARNKTYYGEGFKDTVVPQFASLGTDVVVGSTKRYVENPLNIAVDYASGAIIGGAVGLVKPLASTAGKSLIVSYGNKGVRFVKGVKIGGTVALTTVVAVPTVIDVATSRSPGERAGALATEFTVFGAGFNKGLIKGERAGAEALSSYKQSQLNKKYKGQLTTNINKDLSKDVKGFTVKGEPIEKISFFGQADQAGTLTGYKINYGKEQRINPDEIPKADYYLLNVKGKILEGTGQTPIRVLKENNALVKNDFFYQSETPVNKNVFLSPKKTETFLQTRNIARLSDVKSNTNKIFVAEGELTPKIFGEGGELVPTQKKPKYKSLERSKPLSDFESGIIVEKGFPTKKPPLNFIEGIDYKIIRVKAVEVLPARTKGRVFRISDIIKSPQRDVVVSKEVVKSDGTVLLLEPPKKVIIREEKLEQKPVQSQLQEVKSQQSSQQQFAKQDNKQLFNIKQSRSLSFDSVKESSLRGGVFKRLAFSSQSKAATKEVSLTKQGVIQAFNTTKSFDTNQRFDSSQRFDVSQKFDVAQRYDVQTLSLTNKLSQSSFKNFKENYVPKNISLPGFKFKDSSKGSFSVFVRRNKQFRSIANDVSLQEAQKIALSRVGNTAAVSFKIPGANINAPSGFYASRKEPGVFIESRNRRIKSAGELREITFEGVKAQKRKKQGKKLGGGFF